MRSDMQKIIVERPRRGSSLPSKKTALRLSPAKIRAALEDVEDFDSGPKRAASARHQKWLNENLAPLRRYLMGQVGRPWRKVYGEIRQAIDTRSAIGLHVLQHVPDFVSVHTRMENGLIFETGWCYRQRPVSGLYVHPVTGLLRYAKRATPAASEPEPNLVRVNSNVEYEKIGGYWYRMEYETAVSDEGASIRVLVLKRQCDRRTTQRIESGDFGIPARKYR